MSSVNQDLPDHILSLLGQLLDSLRQEIQQYGMPGGLRTSQIRLLSLTPTDGLRMTDLAARVGMTKQALGEFAAELETRGLLETVRDPRDRRVRILRPTAEGLQALGAATATIAAVETGRRQQMGPEWDQLRALLRRAIDLSP